MDRLHGTLHARRPTEAIISRASFPLINNRNRTDLLTSGAEVPREIFVRVCFPFLCNKK
jgi:hypothetical protein